MKPAILLLHGLTGTPPTLGTLPEELQRAGFDISVPLLAGHGRSADELAKSTWVDWLSTAKIEFEKLLVGRKDIFCVGFSLGSLLALWLAIENPDKIRAMSVIGVPLKLSAPERIAIIALNKSPLKKLIRHVPKDFSKSIADTSMHEAYRKMTTPVMPTAAVFELIRLQSALTPLLNRVTCPIQILHGKHDGISSPSNVELLKRSISSTIIETQIFERSRHILTLDHDKTEVGKAVLEFLCKFK